MKKILFAAALCVAASINAFGVACQSGVTLTAIIQGPACTASASNGNGTWNLSNWSLQVLSTTGFGNQISQNTSDFIVTIAGVADGFSISFSDNPSTTTVGGVTPNNFNFFAPNGNGNQTQTSSFKTGFWVSGGPNLVTVDNSVQNAQGQAIVNVLKTLENFNGTAIVPGDAQVSFANGVFILSSPQTINLSPNRTDLSVVDTVQISSFQSGSGSLDSYTNTFKTAALQGGVPEPMTFVLMGAGLVGIAALRRRKA